MTTTLHCLTCDHAQDFHTDYLVNKPITGRCDKCAKVTEWKFPLVPTPRTDAVSMELLNWFPETLTPESVVPVIKHTMAQLLRLACTIEREHAAKDTKIAELTAELERVKAERDQQVIELESSVNIARIERDQLRADNAALVKERDELAAFGVCARLALKWSMDAMLNWFSSEYALDPMTKKVREVYEAKAPRLITSIEVDREHTRILLETVTRHRDALACRVAELRVALEFYSLPETDCDLAAYEEKIAGDGGDIARNALAALQLAPRP